MGVNIKTSAKDYNPIFPQLETSNSALTIKSIIHKRIDKPQKTYVYGSPEVGRMLSLTENRKLYYTLRVHDHEDYNIVEPVMRVLQLDDTYLPIGDTAPGNRRGEVIHDYEGVSYEQYKKIVQYMNFLIFGMGGYYPNTIIQRTDKHGLTGEENSLFGYTLTINNDWNFILTDTYDDVIMKCVDATYEWNEVMYAHFIAKMYARLGWAKDAGYIVELGKLISSYFSGDRRLKQNMTLTTQERFELVRILYGVLYPHKFVHALPVNPPNQGSFSKLIKINKI